MFRDPKAEIRKEKLKKNSDRVKTNNLDRRQRTELEEEKIGRAWGRWRVASSSYELTARREDRRLRSLEVRGRLINHQSTIINPKYDGNNP